MIKLHKNKSVDSLSFQSKQRNSMDRWKWIEAKDRENDREEDDNDDDENAKELIKLVSSFFFSM